MKSMRVLGLFLFAALAGCPASESTGGDGGNADNPVTKGQIAYCKPKCAKLQACNLDLFNLKWGTLDACELECNPFSAVSACNAQCDLDHATDAAAHATCIAYCEREVSVDGCKAQCEGISDTYAHDSCIAGCDRQFSQACADVWKGIKDCYLGLECQRAIEYEDFGGSASGLGECDNDDAVGTSC